MRSIKEAFKIHFLKTNEGYYFYVGFVTGVGPIGSGVAAAAYLFTG
ncbi:hypothetical protein ACVRZ3_04510 [Streptococcus devriesei]